MIDSKYKTVQRLARLKLRECLLFFFTQTSSFFFNNSHKSHSEHDIGLFLLKENFCFKSVRIIKASSGIGVIVSVEICHL